QATVVAGVHAGIGNVITGQNAVQTIREGELFRRWFASCEIKIEATGLDLLVFRGEGFFPLLQLFGGRVNQIQGCTPSGHTLPGGEEPPILSRRSGWLSKTGVLC